MLARAELIESTPVNEGGGIHVDGSGTVLAAETVQLDPGRNPGSTRADVEAEFARSLGTPSTIWLPRGLTRDTDRFGMRGHVDIVATFAATGVVLLHDQRDPEHPDYIVTDQLTSVLTAALDAHRLPLEIVSLPAPEVLRDAEGFVDYSFVNHVLVNGGVIACAFDDARDADAFAILSDAYPGRTVVAVDARPLFARGGSIHCVTQQQPAV